jgi:hypothetical protein
MKKKELTFTIPCEEVYSACGDIVYMINDGEIVECVHCGADIDAAGTVFVNLVTLSGEDEIFVDKDLNPETDNPPDDWFSKGIFLEASEFCDSVFMSREEAEMEREKKYGKEE